MDKEDRDRSPERQIQIPRRKANDESFDSDRLGEEVS